MIRVGRYKVIKTKIFKTFRYKIILNVLIFVKTIYFIATLNNSVLTLMKDIMYVLTSLLVAQ